MVAPVVLSSTTAAATPAAPRASFGEVLARRLAATTSSPPLAAPALAGLRRVEEARVQLDRAIAQARSGRSFSAGELLALQLDAYRLTQTVDVAAKVAEAGAQSVKQAVNTPM